jgi:PAS domain S-box-containing protein
MNEDAVEILIVEDDDSHIELIRRAFEPNLLMDTRLSEAHTLRAARDFLAETHPHLVIADLLLPDGKGVDLLPVRREEVMFPLVIMTCHGNEQAAVEAIKAGAIDYIVKSDSTFQEMPRIAARALREWDYIVERRQMEQELRKARQDWENIFQAIGHPTLILDSNHNILIANQATMAITRKSQAELVGKKCYEFFHNADHKPQACPMQQMVRSGHLKTVEMEMEAIEGTFLVSCTPVLDEQGKLEKIIHIATDITERKIAEEQIRVHEEQLRSLASELSLIEERQRRDIATSLHDNVGQTLALSKMKLGSLRQQATDTEIHQPLHEIADMIEKTITYTRDLTFQLSPPILYDVGLEAALQWLLDEAKKHHSIKTSFEDDGQIKSLDDNVRVFLFQSVRELLFNITKHAQAKRAKIHVERVDGNIQISVIDNGIGLDVEKLTQPDRKVKGFGLFNIRERLDYLGGEFQIHSQIGKGTTITLIAPLQINH